MDTSLINLANGISQSKVANGVSVAVARKALDAAEQEGAALVSLIDAARVPASPGLGANVDVSA